MWGNGKVVQIGILGLKWSKKSENSPKKAKKDDKIASRELGSRDSGGSLPKNSLRDTPQSEM